MHACSDGRLTVDEDKVPIPQYTKKQMCTSVPPAMSRTATSWAAESLPVERNSRGEYCTACPGFRAPSPAPMARIALFHYITRSREDYEIKRNRGGGSTKIRTWEEFEEFDKCAARCAAARAVRCAVRRCASARVFRCSGFSVRRARAGV